MQSATRLQEFSAHPHLRLSANPVALSTVGATGAMAILDAKTSQFYTLNEVGGRVWSMLREGTTFSAIVDQLQHEYDVSTDVLSADIENLLRKLANAELLRAERA